MNITITMITALFAALRELVGLKSLRDQLLRSLYSVQHERVEDVALPDDIPNDHDYDMPSGSLGLEIRNRDIDMRDGASLFAVTFGECCDVDSYDLAILHDADICYHDLYNMTHNNLIDMGFSDTFRSDVETIKKCVALTVARCRAKEVSGKEWQENISRRLADTNRKLLFLEDLINTFVTASITGSLVQISHQEGIGAREAIDILLESLAINTRIARGYEYGDLPVMPSTVYRAWTT